MKSRTVFGPLAPQLVGSCVLASAFGAGTALAQSTSSSPEASAALSEIVVTAQRRDERLQDVPIAVSVVTGEILRRSTFRGVTEVLNTVPSVSTNENYLGGGTNVTVRGVIASTPTLSGSSAIAYYLDELPFGLLRSSLSPDASVYDLERVEVLRGPQGTLYGASALNGVVRVLTRDADLSEFEAAARATTSSTDHGGLNYRGDFMVNVPLVEDKLAIRAVVGYQDDEGWIDTLNREDANDRQVETYRIAFGARPVENLSINLSGWSSRSKSGMPSFGYTYDQIRTLLDQPIETTYDLGGLTIAYDFPSFTLASSTSYLDYYNFADLALDIPDFFGGFADSSFIQSINAYVFSQELSLTSEGEGPWRWSLGAMYRHATENLGQFYIGAFAFLPVLDHNNLSKSAAVYGELTRVLDDGKWELTAGLRYFSDDASQRHQTGIGAPINEASSSADATTPRLVASWHPNDDITAYISYGQGFRSGFPPNDAVLGADPNFPALEPDRLNNYEIGSKGRLFEGAFSYEVAVYYIDWEDVQQQIAVDILGIPFPAQVNGESAGGPGVDMSLALQPTNGLTLTATAGWNGLEMDADIISGGAVLFNAGDRLNGSPEYTASAGLDYSFPIGGGGYEGTFDATATYTSEQSYRGIGLPGVSESDEILTAKTSFTLDASNGWTFAAFVDNVTNERGFPAEIFVGITDWRARLRPRTVGLQLEYRFH